MIKRLSVAKEKFKDTCIQEEAKETHTHTKKQNGQQFKTGAIIIFLSFFFLTQCYFSISLSYLAEKM